MGAINGIFERHGNSVSRAAFSMSFDGLNTFGVEGEDHWFSSSIALGHKKTSLFVDDEIGTNPLHDKNGGLAITSKARIDNRNELCENLTISINQQKNLTDNELILKSWQKWGRDCPLHLIGDYAFAIWDDREKLLFCARDHIGVVPFYYSLSNERFVFASDINGVLSDPNVSNELDDEYVCTSLLYKNFFTLDRTYYSSIRRLRPGHTLTVRKNSKTIKKYWFPENADKIRYQSNEEYSQAALEILTRSVNDRLETKKKIGIHVSGGLDSSAIAVLASQRLRDKGLAPPEAFVWQAPPEEYKNFKREYEQIEAICKQETFSPVYCPRSAEDIVELLKKDPAREPIGSSANLEWTVQKEASRRDVELILSGWGGDEALSFNGRGYYPEALLQGKIGELLAEGRRRKSPFRFLAYEALLLLFSDRDEGMGKIRKRSLKTPKATSLYLRDELKNKAKPHRIPCRQSSVRSTMLWLWNTGKLTERIESWSALGAPLGIRYAFPLLDRRLMEFVVGLPREQFIQNGWRRWIMRKTLEGIAPHNVAWQPNKDEPARIEASKKPKQKVIELLNKEIDFTKGTFSRAKYLKMDVLKNALRNYDSIEKSKKNGLKHALQFLDF